MHCAGIVAEVCAYFDITQKDEQSHAHKQKLVAISEDCQLLLKKEV